MKENKGPVAVIDVGAHFARLEIVQLSKNDKKYETLERLTQVVPLGMDVFTSGKISNTNTFLVGKILKDFSEVIEEYKVKNVRAMATSAVREAVNKDLFIDRVKKISGIKLSELDPAIEAKNMFMAVKEEMGDQYGFLEKNSIICSIGTGVIQASFCEKGVLKSAESARVGSLRLVEEFQQPLNSVQLKNAVRPFVETAVTSLLSQSNLDFNSSLLIGTGSSVRILARFIEESGDDDWKKSVYCISKEQFDEIYFSVSKLSPDEIAAKLNISDTLAQSIEPSCVILYHFMNACKADNLIIPSVSTRDGIIGDFIREVSKKDDLFLPFLYSCVKNLGERYKYDSRHAEKVTDISDFIFDKTRFLHNLGDEEREMLKIASYLHDIGIYINIRSHHKNSCFLIKNSQIPGLTCKEKNIVGLIARYHRKGGPKETHYDYQVLSSKNKVLVNMLSAILRIADALDFIGKSNIEDIKFNHVKKIMEIVVPDTVDEVLESWSVKRKADLFTDVFGYKVMIVGK